MTEPAGALPGLSVLAGRYEVLFCDIWGVVHNGLVAHPPAYDALVQYRRQGGRIVLISNAPRPSPPIIVMLDRMGVPRDAYDAIVSSGDCSRAEVARYRGKIIHHVGPPTEDDALYEGLDVTRGRAEDAEVVVVTDLDDDNDTPDMYADRLALWLKRGLPMICANPDKVVESGDRIIYCGGALADVYQAMGGKVLMAGKPYAPIYEEALRLAEKAAGHALAKRKILAVGDSVRTDATGAAGFGIDLLFITGAIHAAEIGTSGDEAVRAFVAPSGANLAGFMTRLAW